jgi:hypothetical protein
MRAASLSAIIVLVASILLYGCGKSGSATKQSNREGAQLVKDIESYLGVTFPQSTIRVNAFYDHDHSPRLAFMVEFGKEDLATFMSARDSWMTAASRERVEITKRFDYVDTWVRTVKWWRLQKDNLQFAWMQGEPKDVLYRVIWIEKERHGKHKVYIEVHDIRRNLPPEIRHSVFGPESIWRSGYYPKRASEETD